MVTLIDNLSLNPEERVWYERIIGLPPFTARVSQWLNLEDLANDINENLGNGEIHIVVATGGVEVYCLQNPSQNVFVFNSPNFGDTNKPTSEIGFEDYKRITENPAKHHAKEIQRLRDYLSKYQRRPIKIIEGDVGNTGLSMSRLCAIYQSVYDLHQAGILIGAAPEGNIFSVLRRSSLVLLSGSKFYQEDLRRILGLDKVQHKIIAQCKDGYIRRASENLGVEFSEDVNEDISKWEEFYKKEGLLAGQKLREYSAMFRHLTLKKIEHIKLINEKLKQLGGP